MDEAKKARVAELRKKRDQGALSPDDEKEYQDLQNQRAQESADPAKAQENKQQ